MKKNKVLFWAACLFSVLSFTSCLSDEENGCTEQTDDSSRESYSV